MRSCVVALALLVVPATAQAQTVLFQDDFEAGLGNWTVEQLSCQFYNCNTAVTWQVLDTAHPCAAWAAPFPSGSKAAWFGRTPQCNYDGGVGTAPHAALKSIPIALPAGQGSIRLGFRSKSYAENEPFVDVRFVGVLPQGVSQPIELHRIFNSSWYEDAYDLTPYAGTSLHLWFEFITGDPELNDRNGWYIDDVRVEAVSSTGVTFCAGDGSSGTPCPCANFGAPGRGCATSFNPNGAQITGLGTPSVSADTLVLAANGVAESFLTFVQGSNVAGYGQGVVFGDGLLCADSPLIRLALVFAPGGMTTYPGAGQTPISVAGLVGPPGGLRTYQAWFRDSSLTHCTPATYSMTNGLMLTWRP